MQRTTVPLDVGRQQRQLPNKKRWELHSGDFVGERALPGQLYC